MHALIIEDEPLIAMGLEEALRGCGFSSFEFAVSADEAVAAAARRCPHLITADIKLAQGCGISAVQAICSDRTIPVIFITGSAEQVRLRMPGHELIEKPFNIDHLRQATERILGGRSIMEPNSNGGQNG